jgi:filamentous hemagglutinin family protein
MRSRIALRQNWLHLFVFISIFVLKEASATAQITPDNTLGTESSLITPNVQIQDTTGDRISGGAQRGANLFHSFSQFNVSDGQRVYFVNPIGVQNILTRITGGLASNIFGTLGVEGSANLFLLNPNGILFGPNARLDVSGSFVATTASAFRFGEQGLFGATDPETPPLLTVNPSALLFNQLKPGSIANRGSLVGGTGKNLVLAGGDISFNGGLINIPDGGLDLAAIAGTGTVGIDPDNRLNIPTNLPRADISMFGSQIAVLASNGDGVRIYARNLDISGNSSIRSSIGSGVKVGDRQVGNTLLDATGTVQIREGSQIANIIAENESGNTGDIWITAESLFLNSGAQLNTDIFGWGDVGDIIINTRDRIVLDNSANIFSNVEKTGKGKGANISISTGSLSVSRNAQLQTNTFGVGDAGNIIINARNLVSLETNGIVSSTVRPNASGQGGNIEIASDSLVLDGETRIAAITASQGNGGDIIINARDLVTLNGSAGIINNAQGSSGQGGDIRVTTQTLKVTGLARLQTATVGQGSAGDILIKARDRVELSGGVKDGRLRDTILSIVAPSAVGNGGNIEIETGSLSVIDRAGVVATTEGRGNAGSIIIKARDSVLFDRGTALSTVEVNAIGNSGNIEVTTGSFALRNGAQLDASTFSQGNSGDIIINARDNIVVDGYVLDRMARSGGRSSTIFSEVFEGAQGNGGDIYINTGSLSITNSGQIDVKTNGRGDAGNIYINARDLVVLDGARPEENLVTRVINSVEEGAIGKGGNIEIKTGSMTVTNGAQLLANTLGQGDAGNIIIDARDSVSFDGATQRTGKYSSAAFSSVNSDNAGQGGDIRITTGSLSVTDRALLNATTWGQGKAGNVILNARDRITVNNGSVYSAVGQSGKGDGGGIIMTARDINFDNRAEIAVGSLGSGEGGTIQIQANTLRLSNASQISAVTATTNGGDIALTLKEFLLLRQGSSISTTAGTRQTGGNGGNVTITAPFIVSVLSENNDVTANAYSGQGGNIRIKTQGIFGIQARSKETLFSDITASSTLGVQGQIAIEQLEVQPTQELIELPGQVIDASNQIAQICPRGIAALNMGRFIITGRGGLPPSPFEMFTSDAMLYGWVILDPNVDTSKSPLTSSNPTTRTPEPIVEATGWVRNSKGEIVLTSDTRTTTHEPWQNPMSCRASKVLKISRGS